LATPAQATPLALFVFFFFSIRRRHTRLQGDWSSDVCSSDLVSQETLAEMIGTTLSRVNVFMNKFRKLGFIKYNGGIEINTSLLRSEERRVGKECTFLMGWVDVKQYKLQKTYVILSSSSATFM